MINRLKTSLSRNLTNARGWRTNRKIVVIESDDWGSIRMPNTTVQKKYEALGYDITNNPYCKYDTLANSEDLEVLFSSLSKFKDKRGNNPIITFNTVMGNPVFDKIKESKFEAYFYEPFTETLKHYYPNENVFELWKQGVEAKLIQPQFHGREHVNVPLWLEELRKNNKPLIDAFDLDFWGIPKSLYTPKNLNIQASYDSNKKDHINFYNESIIEGLNLFEEIFGYRSTTFIANNYTWSNELNNTLKTVGIKGFQSMKYQKMPFSISDKKRPKKEVFTGRKTDDNQIYMVRNCVFEPSQYKKEFDNISSCLKQIEQAFFFKKPAILSCHRINFIGALDKKNRTINIESLNILLSSILQKWPDVEFLSSDQLVEVINN